LHVVKLRAVLAFIAFLTTVSHAGAAGLLERIQSSGVFKIGYRADARPFSYRSANGEPAGYVVELCREVAVAVRESKGTGRLDVRYVVVNAQNRFAALQDGSVDIVCDSSSVTMGRRELVDFSLPTFVDGAGLIYRGRDDLLTFESLRDKRVGVVSGTTTEALLQSSMSGIGVKASISPLKDYAAGIDRLLDQSLDAFMGDRSILASMLRDRGAGSGLRLSRSYYSYEVYALVLPRDEAAFRLLVDRTLARLYRSGRVKTLLARTFGDLQDDAVLQNLIIINSLPE
jgi:ABC-type amino acid transport substrate-binding protein